MASSQDDLNSQPSALTTTVDLIERFKRGDNTAVDLLVERSLPPLIRWARERVPLWARNVSDTQDMVHDAVVRAMPDLKAFEASHPGALQAYLRQAIASHIKDEIRKVRPEPTSEVRPSEFDSAPTPLEQAIGRERLARYEAALATLGPTEREAIIARVELQQSYEEVAIALGKPTAEAARKVVTRALRSLIDAMGEL